MRLFMILLALFCLTGPSLAVDEPKQEREGGIIGTGIVGTITALGSIIVNDQRVTFPSDFKVTSPVGELLAADLIPGQTVAVTARDAQKDWQALTILEILPLVGPLNRLDGKAFVLGSEVRLTDRLTSELANFQDGDWVAVSGLWQNGVLVASHIRRIGTGQIASVTGNYAPLDGADQFQIGGTKINGAPLEHIAFGDVVTVLGEPNPDGIVAEHIRIGTFAGPVQSIIAEGFMSAPQADGLYTINGSGVRAFTDNPQMIDDSSVGVFCIRLEPDARFATVAPMADVGDGSCR